MPPVTPVKHVTEIRALATLLSAGLGVQQALESLLRATNSPQAQRELKAMLVQIQKGAQLTAALQSQQWSTPDRTLLLELAEKCGRLPEALTQLASEKESAIQRTRYLRVRLAGTVLLALLAALISAGLASQKSNLSFWHYFLGNIPALIQLIMGAALLVWLVTRERSFWANISWQAPPSLTGAKHVFEVYWADALRLSLESGMDMTQTASQLKTLLRCDNYRANMQTLSNRISGGTALCQALADWPLSPQLRAVLKAGEAAGTLPSALRHFVTLETQHLTLTRQAIDEWLPRVFYLWAITLSAVFF